jgi:indole-3-glycerol phosphate synthase
MSDILQRIVAEKRREVAGLMRRHPLAEVRGQALAAPPVRDFPAVLKGARPRGGEPGASAESSTEFTPVRIIAEIKRRSPSKGEFPFHGDVARQARAYEQSGARAISVVTDGPFFGGSTDWVAQARDAVGLPVLQKEFLLEPWQVFYARALGADACLLIAAILPGDLLGEMAASAREAGIHTLVEVTGEEEFLRAADVGAVVIGVNNRDLRTFSVDLARTESLLPLYGDERICIAESGIHTRRDVLRLLEAGVDGFLIGEALMTAEDPAAHLRGLREAPESGDQPREAAS